MAFFSFFHLFLSVTPGQLRYINIKHSEYKKLQAYVIPTTSLICNVYENRWLKEVFKLRAFFFLITFRTSYQTKLFYLKSLSICEDTAPVIFISQYLGHVIISTYPLFIKFLDFLRTFLLKKWYFFWKFVELFKSQ